MTLCKWIFSAPCWCHSTVGAEKWSELRGFDDELAIKVEYISLVSHAFVFFVFFILICIFQTMPTDMCALQDFDEPDKLHILINDVITIIEGRWVCLNL